MLTRTGNNAAMRTKRSKGLWVVAALLAVNATLLVAQPGSRCRGRSATTSSARSSSAPRCSSRTAASCTTTAIDRGVIRNKAGGTLTLLERDGTLVPIPVAPTAAITLNGRPVGVLRAPARYGRDRDSGRRRSGERGPRHPQMTAAGAAELHPAGTPGPQLLLVEDEESIGSLVRAYLEQTGYRVAWVRSGEDALQSLETVRPRLVILDIGLPGADGFDVCRSIRTRSDVPVLMLTARDEEADRVAGLEVGADDYVSKPFSPRELAARVKAVLRRTGPSARAEVLELGDVARRPAGARGTRRRRDRRADRQGVRPARLPDRQRRHRRLARPAARPGLGHELRGRHAHRRRPRRAAAPQARPARVDPHRARLRLQGHPTVKLQSLRARLFAAIALVALLSLALALALGAILTRRAVERNTLRDVSAQFDLLVEREREAIVPFSLPPLAAGVPRPAGRARRAGAARRLVDLLLPPERAAQLSGAASELDGTLETDGTRYSLRGAAREREGLHPAPPGELDHVRVAAAHRGARRRRGRHRRPGGADRVPARARDRPSGQTRRGGDARARELDHDAAAASGRGPARARAPRRELQRGRGRARKGARGRAGVPALGQPRAEDTADRDPRLRGRASAKARCPRTRRPRRS